MTKKQKDSSKPKRRRKYCKTSSKIIRRKKRKKSDSTKKLNDALLATLRDVFDEPEARNAALLATLDDIVGAEQSELDLKIRRGRGMAQKSRELIDAMYAAAEKAQSEEQRTKLRGLAEHWIKMAEHAQAYAHGQTRA